MTIKKPIILIVIITKPWRGWNLHLTLQCAHCRNRKSISHKKECNQNKSIWNSSHSLSCGTWLSGDDIWFQLDLYSWCCWQKSLPNYSSPSAFNAKQLVVIAHDGLLCKTVSLWNKMGLITSSFALRDMQIAFIIMHVE